MKIEYFKKRGSGKCEILDYVASLAVKDSKKILNRMDELCEDGGFKRLSKIKAVKPISGSRGLWELRPVCYRLFFTIKGPVYRFLLIFKKQGQKKGYPRHIKRAEGIKKQWEEIDKGN